jgi:hypothetical protein
MWALSPLEHDMKVKIEFTVDVIPENIQVYLDEVGFDDETVREFVKSYFQCLAPMLDDTIMSNVGLPAIKNYN